MDRMIDGWLWLGGNCYCDWEDVQWINEAAGSAGAYVMVSLRGDVDIVLACGSLAEARALGGEIRGRLEAAMARASKAAGT